MDFLWELFRAFMLKSRPMEFSSVIGGEQGWKETFQHFINKPQDDWPESMMFWSIQLRNSAGR